MILFNKERGDVLPVPEGKTIGFVDTEDQLNSIARALNDAGYPDSKIAALHGPEGVEMLERLRDIPFFGDFERAVADKGIHELQKGHYSLAVTVRRPGRRRSRRRHCRAVRRAQFHVLRQVGQRAVDQVTCGLNGVALLVIQPAMGRPPGGLVLSRASART